MNLKRYIGDRKFYAMVLAIAVPIMVQNGITNFVAMIDNIMIGQGRDGADVRRRGGQISCCLFLM